jgi:hypothetical protein
MIEVTSSCLNKAEIKFSSPRFGIIRIEGIS